MSYVRRSLRLLFCTGIALVVLTVPLAALAGNNDCNGEDQAPDVIVGSIYQKNRYGTSGGITAFSIGTISCNIGTCWLDWFSGSSNLHPVIGQNMFRLQDGRFEQIGQSWLKHGFTALSQTLCHNDCQGTSGTHLGVHCSDPYSASLNGSQTGLGPKFEVDAATGFHPHPVTDIFLTGPAIYKRMQVHNVDLDPSINPAAQYFVEGQYVTQDDSAADNDDNNASWRPVNVTGSGTFFDFSLTGDTVREEPAILAWLDADPTVEIETVDVPGDGRFHIGAKARNVGGGMWNYEYAIQNLNSSRSGASFTVPIPFGSTPTNIGFHDVDYHSGEPFGGTDWQVTVDATSITWATESQDVNPDANALRWGTLYNFRFDLNAEPVKNDVTLGLFYPGTPTEMIANVTAPLICNTDGTCDPGEDCLCLDDCPGEGTDNDGDFVGICVDCDDADIGIWAKPSEALDLLADYDQDTGITTLNWSAPADPGATIFEYEALRSTNPVSFFGPGTPCLPDADPTDTTLEDSTSLPTGRVFNYLIRATNTCPDGLGVGTLGFNSDNDERIGNVCP